MNIKQLTKPFLFSTALVLGGLHMSAWVSNDGAFRVQHVEVEGCQYSSESEVRAAAQAPDAETAQKGVDAVLSGAHPEANRVAGEILGEAAEAVEGHAIHF